MSLLRRAHKLARLVMSPRYWRGLRHGVAAAIEHERLMRTLSIGTLIDVGANVGQFSFLARALHPDVCIHAFEPLPAMAAAFERLFARDLITHMHRVAAGEASGTATIYISGRPDSSSLLPITDLQVRTFPGTAQASMLTVDVVRLDDALAGSVLPGAILIKLDVQGYELSALAGMPRVLERAQYVYAEISFRELYAGQPLAGEVVAWLAVRGFRLAGIYNLIEAADGFAIQADALFVNSKPLSTN